MSKEKYDFTEVVNQVIEKFKEEPVVGLPVFSPRISHEVANSHYNENERYKSIKMDPAYFFEKVYRETCKKLAEDRKLIPLAQLGNLAIGEDVNVFNCNHYFPAEYNQNIVFIPVKMKEDGSHEQIGLYNEAYNTEHSIAFTDLVLAQLYAVNMVEGEYGFLCFDLNDVPSNNLITCGDRDINTLVVDGQTYGYLMASSYIDSIEGYFRKMGGQFYHLPVFVKGEHQLNHQEMKKIAEHGLASIYVTRSDAIDTYLSGKGGEVTTQHISKEMEVLENLCLDTHGQHGNPLTVRYLMDRTEKGVFVYFIVFNAPSNSDSVVPDFVLRDIYKILKKEITQANLYYPLPYLVNQKTEEIKAVFIRYSKVKDLVGGSSLKDLIHYITPQYLVKELFRSFGAFGSGLELMVGRELLIGLNSGLDARFKDFGIRYTNYAYHTLLHDLKDEELVELKDRLKDNGVFIPGIVDKDGFHQGLIAAKVFYLKTTRDFVMDMNSRSGMDSAVVYVPVLLNNGSYTEFSNRFGHHPLGYVTEDSVEETYITIGKFSYPIVHYGLEEICEITHQTVSNEKVQETDGIEDFAELIIEAEEKAAKDLAVRMVKDDKGNYYMKTWINHSGKLLYPNVVFSTNPW
jgi:hypothetical protein|nr:MAG TPA: hypothetical protein [Caudoviricetes sp.]